MNQSVFDTILQYTSAAPVDVFGMARDLGIEIIEKKLEGERSGSIEKKNGKYTITVNEQHGVKRKRFTVAHEIGHYIFHGDLIESGAIVDDKLYRDERVGGVNEAQANRFAASILMPEKLITSLRNMNGIDTIHGLAEALKVSERAMSIRAENLNLISEIDPLPQGL